MKHLGKISLNAPSERMANREMKLLIGGNNCGCGCCYMYNGGSSTADNKSANNAGNLHSSGMTQVAGYMCEDGSWYYYPLGQGPWIGGCYS